MMAIQIYTNLYHFSRTIGLCSNYHQSIQQVNRYAVRTGHISPSTISRQFNMPSFSMEEVMKMEQYQSKH